MNLENKEVREHYRKYYETVKTFDQYSLNLPDGYNNIDPLAFLELINGDNTIAQRLEVITKLVKGKKVEIMCLGKKVKAFTHNGEGSLSLLFLEEPYLLQVTIDYLYALILKKLTPPSSDFSEAVTEEEKA